MLPDLSLCTVAEVENRRLFRLHFLVCLAETGPGAMEAVDTVVRPVKDFAKDSIRLVKRCHKPDRRGTD